MDLRIGYFLFIYEKFRVEIMVKNKKKKII